MPYMIRQLTKLSMLALIAGCTQQGTNTVSPVPDSSHNSEILAPDLYPNGAKSDDGANVRYGRYTLVNTAPEIEQRDLMAQIIDVNIPGNMHPQVQDAMQYVTDRSGYSLCPASTDHVNILYTRPLPAAQYKLGPMTLRNTLQVLAGPAWRVKVNEVTRQVCFELRSGYQAPETPRPAQTVVTAVPGMPSLPPIPASAYTANKAAKGTPTAAAVVSIPPATTSVTVAAPASQPIITSSPPPGTATSSSPPSTMKSATSEQPPSALAKDRPPSPSSSTATPVASSQPATSNPSALHPTPVAPPVLPTAKPVFAVSTPAPARSMEPLAPAQTWDAAVGSTLRQTVEAWAKKAEWQLIWAPSDLDYPIEAALHFRGTFAEAISQIFPLYDGAKRSFTVDGNTTQRIVHISERKKL